MTRRSRSWRPFAGRPAIDLLETLPNGQREAIQARHLDERRYSEIAVELHCSESVVRKRVSRGLAALRSGFGGGDRRKAAVQVPSFPARLPPGDCSPVAATELGGTFEPLETLIFEPPNTLRVSALRFNMPPDPVRVFRAAIERGAARDGGETKLDGRAVRRVRLEPCPDGECEREPSYVYVDPTTFHQPRTRGHPDATPGRDRPVADRGVLCEGHCCARLITEMTERDPALEPFEVLIGTWATEAIHPAVDAVVPGSVTFEWLEGGHFLVQRSHHDHGLFPDSISVIGAPEHGDGLVLEAFDSRGVRRTYGVSLDDGVLRMWRDAPGFDQRFSATLARDTFEGQWQLASTPGDWQDDLKVTYRRRD